MSSTLQRSLLRADAPALTAAAGPVAAEPAIHAGEDFVHPRRAGSVIGSASIAAFMQARLEANLPGASEASGGFGGGTLPPFVIDGFSTAMAQAILLPASVMLIGVVAVLFMRRTKPSTEEWKAAEAAV